MNGVLTKHEYMHRPIGLWGHFLKPYTDAKYHVPVEGLGILKKEVGVNQLTSYYPQIGLHIDRLSLLCRNQLTVGLCSVHRVDQP